MVRKKTVRLNIDNIIKAVKGQGVFDIDRIIDNEIDPIIDLLNTKKVKFKTSLEDYVVVRLVAYFEIQMKDFAIWLIDKGIPVDVTKLVQNELRIPITDLDNIRDKNFTRGGIIATNFNFQNLADVNYIFSRIFKLNLIETLKDYTNWPNSPFTQKSDIKKIADNWESFEKMFEERNKIVHTEYFPRKKKSPKYLEMLRVVTVLFCFCTFTILLLIRESENKKSKNTEVKKFMHKKYQEYKIQNSFKTQEI